MEVTDTRTYQVSDESEINEARRQLIAFAQTEGINEKCCDRISVVCQELTSNLIKHTRAGGTLLAQIVVLDGIAGLDMYCLDSGVGMDIGECMVDGFSSKGTLGTGLGAIKRMSDKFEIDSSLHNGTVIHVRLWNSEQGSESYFAWGGMSVPKNNELLSGDKWSIQFNERAAYCLMVDGLGHGIEASEASALAVKRFKENQDMPPSAMVKMLHTSLRGSRGAVGAVAKVDSEGRKLQFCGLGNIEGITYNGEITKHLVSLNGTLGYEARKFNEYTLPWTAETKLVLHTDGFTSKTCRNVPELASLSPGCLAGSLYRGHARDTDDATILVLTGSKA
jgi:Anti-sigma regulatory factor (Ser/Thr protein kinase)